MLTSPHIRALDCFNRILDRGLDLGKHPANITGEIERAILADRDEITVPVQNALKVLLLTPHIRDYLQSHDPKALAQAREALGMPQPPARFAPFTKIQTQIDGDEPIQMIWQEFIHANFDGIPLDELLDIQETLKRGEVYWGGGGAAPGFTVKLA